MIINKKTLFSLLLGFDFLTNVLALTHANFFYISTILSFCTYTLLTGFLISLILHIKKISFWENLLYIVGLGTAFLEFGGLLLNTFLPLIGIADPLAFQNIIIGFNIYVLLLFIFAWIRTQPFVVQISEQSGLDIGTGPIKHARSSQFVKLGSIDTRYRILPNVDTITTIPIQLPSHPRAVKVLYAMPLFFPILATFGAIALNNGHSNILTLVLLGTIAFYSLILVLFRDKIPGDLYPYAIFFIGVACLFTTSLRSWYITGHDIEMEFYVFQLTNTHHIWSMALYQDAYNACLSITILPTVLSNLLSIQDLYVYKVIFQIIFAFSPVVLFFIMKNYTTPVFAFLCAFFFMSFPTFFNDMPMLNRQEIGFIFFGLVLYMMLLSSLPIATRKMLFIIFALSVIVSHYSTNFVLLSLVAFVYISTFIISLPLVKKIFAALLSKSWIKPRNTFPNKVFLSLPLLLLLFLMTYFWNTLYTHSSNHTGSVIAEVVTGLFVQSDAHSNDLSYSIFSSPKKDPQKELQEYIQSVRQAAVAHSEKANTNQFYSKLITDKYPTYPLQQEQLAPTPLGNLLSSFHISVFDVQAELRSLSASFMQIFVLIGLLTLFFMKSKKTFDVQYLFLCFGSLLLLALITLLPSLSIEYGVLRMFQQLLFILSLPIVLGLSSILFFAKEQRRILFVAITAIIFFLNLTGLISHLTGDYYPQMTLDNGGLYYDAYYVHKSDVFSIIWLSKNDGDHEPIEADLSGINKLRTYGNIIGINEVFPSVVLKNAYVYLEISSRIVVSIDKNTLIYSSSKSFLDDNKNLIYSSSRNNIYK